MQLFTLKCFRGRPMCIHNGWKMSGDGTMVIDAPDGIELLCKRITLEAKHNIGVNTVLDGIVRSDGKYGIFCKDAGKLKNKNKALLLVVSEGNILLPDHLYHDNRVRIEPVANQEGSLVVSIICFLKTEELSLVFENEDGRKETFFSYDMQTRFPSIIDVTPNKSKQPDRPGKKWWQTLLLRGFSGCGAARG